MFIQNGRRSQELSTVLPCQGHSVQATPLWRGPCTRVKSQPIRSSGVYLRERESWPESLLAACFQERISRLEPKPRQIRKNIACFLEFWYSCAIRTAKRAEYVDNLVVARIDLQLSRFPTPVSNAISRPWMGWALSLATKQAPGSSSSSNSDSYGHITRVLLLPPTAHEGTSKSGNEQHGSGINPLEPGVSSVEQSPQQWDLSRRHSWTSNTTPSPEPSGGVPALPEQGPCM
jgi:hypothetical protein